MFLLAGQAYELGNECDYPTKLAELEELMRQFDEAMAPLTATGALKMSTSDHWNDLYLARAYPFLYARKIRYAAKSHAWERFLIAYGGTGVHYVVLFAMSLAIILGYRHLAQCSRFGGSVFARPEWPNTCLLNVGQRAGNFSALRGAQAGDFMAVSCGTSGYVPNNEEWDAQSDYFTDP
jgi:hypothetical protein